MKWLKSQKKWTADYDFGITFSCIFTSFHSKNVLIYTFLFSFIRSTHDAWWASYLLFKKTSCFCREKSSKKEKQYSRLWNYEQRNGDNSPYAFYVYCSCFCESIVSTQQTLSRLFKVLLFAQLLPASNENYFTQLWVLLTAKTHKLCFQLLFLSILLRFWFIWKCLWNNNRRYWIENKWTSTWSFRFVLAAETIFLLHWFLVHFSFEVSIILGLEYSPEIITVWIPQQKIMSNVMIDTGIGQTDVELSTSEFSKLISVATNKRLWINLLICNRQANRMFRELRSSAGFKTNRIKSTEKIVFFFKLDVKQKKCQFEILKCIRYFFHCKDVEFWICCSTFVASSFV